MGPGVALQATIGNVWRDVLRLDVVPDPDENFFDAGGDSLLLLSVHRRLEAELRVPIGVIDLFEHVTIRRLAAFVGRASLR
jgi:acyl carrier protein